MSSGAGMARRLAPRTPAGPLSVLLLEDERDQRETLRDALQAVGLHVEAVESSAAAVACLNQNIYETVISDAVLEDDIRGEQFMIEYGGLMADAKKVVITAYDKAAVKRQSELDKCGVIVLEKGRQELVETLKLIASQQGSLEPRHPESTRRADVTEEAEPTPRFNHESVEHTLEPSGKSILPTTEEPGPQPWAEPVRELLAGCGKIGFC